jgi:hypothetical protein
MGAAVRVDATAFSDERYVTLARLAGLTDSDHARGKMLRLWRQCTDRNVQILTVECCESVLGANASEALTKSELGEVVDGGIRICGTSGRIEWLQKLRKNGRKGGKARAKQELSNGLAHQEKEIEKDLPSPEALSAAEELRGEVVAKQPTHQLSKCFTQKLRLAWAKEFDVMHAQDGRAWPEVCAVIRWLFHEQGSEYAFVVQSPSALRKKWDAIADRRARPRPSNGNRPQEPIRFIPDLSKPS